jgi:predicted DNA-binding protein YlxM (UPF0122 family)
MGQIMDLPEARQHKNLLFDFYENLLTQKQRDIFTMHCMEDCSLAEIGSMMGTTSQAVSDLLKRTAKRLSGYEKQLGLVEKHKNQQAAAEKIKHELEKLKIPPDEKIHKLIEDIIAHF